jgi:phosphatidylserine decarboxylase
LSLIFLILILYTLAFFRDPDREVPADPGSVVAAADGAIADIVEVEEGDVLKTKTRRVGIFLSIFDVHTNRAPIAGRVIYREHREGLCVDARRADCSEKNESMTWAFANSRATIVVRQLTGAIARRIVGWSQVGDELKKGDRFGMIRFGSRTEVYLPLTATVLVKVGDHVSGGSTIIARLPEQ